MTPTPTPSETPVEFGTAYQIDRSVELHVVLQNSGDAFGVCGVYSNRDASDIPFGMGANAGETSITLNDQGHGVTVGEITTSGRNIIEFWFAIEGESFTITGECNDNVEVYFAS